MSQQAEYTFTAPSIEFTHEDAHLRQEHTDHSDEILHHSHAPLESPVYKRIRILKFTILALLCILIVYNVVMVVADGLQLTQWYSSGQVAKNPEDYKSAFVLFAIHLCSCVIFVGITVIGFASITPFRNRTQFILGLIFIVCLFLIFSIQSVLIIAMVSIGPDFLKPGYGSSLVPLYILTIGITVLSGLRSYYVYQVIL
jgi:magnesium-transporting ATPase (P-type)